MLCQNKFQMSLMDKRFKCNKSNQIIKALKEIMEESFYDLRVGKTKI